jgi:uncharacterized protein
MHEGERGGQRCVAITGASGLVGRRLIARLHEDGWEVARVVRRETRADRHEIAWQPSAGTIDASAFEGIDAVVHLAGEEIAERWTKEKKERILRSRVDGTGLIARTLASLERPPRVLVSASGVHYYGSRGDEVLTEDSGPGEGFLAGVVREWEAATEPAREAGIRVVRMRTAPVIAREGGLIDRVLLPFRLGLGGRLGSGDQYMSWIAAPDLVRAFSHVLEHEEIAGPVNAAAPEPVRNREFTEALGRVLDRPTVLPVPALAIRALLGEMGEELLLSSMRVHPTRLLESGFEFGCPTLAEALAAELGEPPAEQGARE